MQRVEPFSAANVPLAQGRQDDEPVSFANSPANRGFGKQVRLHDQKISTKKCVYYAKAPGENIRNVLVPKRFFYDSPKVSLTNTSKLSFQWDVDAPPPPKKKIGILWSIAEVRSQAQGNRNPLGMGDTMHCPQGSRWQNSTEKKRGLLKI